MTSAAVDETTSLSKQYDTPLGLAHDTMQALKGRIKTHYDLASEYYLNLWYVDVAGHKAARPISSRVDVAQPSTRQFQLVYPRTSIQLHDCSYRVLTPDNPHSGAPIFIMAIGQHLNRRPMRPKTRPRSTSSASSWISLRSPRGARSSTWDAGSVAPRDISPRSWAAR